MERLQLEINPRSSLCQYSSVNVEIFHLEIEIFGSFVSPEKKTTHNRRRSFRPVIRQFYAFRALHAAVLKSPSLRETTTTDLLANGANFNKLAAVFGRCTDANKPKCFPKSQENNRCSQMSTRRLCLCKTSPWMLAWRTTTQKLADNFFLPVNPPFD